MKRRIAWGLWASASIGTGVAVALGMGWGPVIEAPDVPVRYAGSRRVAVDVELARGVALVAHYAGEGVVNCDVAQLLPPGRAVGIRRGFVSDGMLLGTVSDARGRALVRGEAGSSAALVLIRWEAAWPGELGTCVAEPAQQAPVDGWVVDRNGRPVFGEVQAPVGVVAVGLDGRFEAACWHDVPCALRARASLAAPWGEPLWVVPDGPMYGLEVVSGPPRPEPEVVPALAAQVARDRRSSHPDPLQLALDDSGFPASARFMVELWQARERGARQSAAGLLEGLMVTVD